MFNGYLAILLQVCSRITHKPHRVPDWIPTGITVGAVVVPQGMAYALLAQLPPQFGLYSSFMGVMIYWFFATSKDITIGVNHTLVTLYWQVANLT
jgi:MFS superfamily sulfate permease-like transporter